IARHAPRIRNHPVRILSAIAGYISDIVDSSIGVYMRVDLHTDLQHSQCKPLKPAPNAHFKRNFQPFCTLDVENGQARNQKGRDCGCALATGSCEEANSVDAYTVPPLDVITAFAVQQ